MPYSSATTTLVVATDTVSVPFPYLLKAHVKVAADGVAQPQSGFTWIDDSTIQLPNQLDAGTVVKVYRETPRNDLLVVFTAGDFDHKDLNKGLKQLLYFTQETLDAGAQAAEVAASILEYVDEMTALRDEVQDIADGIEDVAEWFDIAISVPFDTAAGDYPAYFTTPAATTFVFDDLSRWNIRANSEAHTLTHIFQIMLRTGDPPGDGTLIATATLPAGEDIGNITTSQVSNISIPAGSVIAVKTTAADASLNSFALTLALRRE